MMLQLRICAVSVQSLGMLTWNYVGGVCDGHQITEQRWQVYKYKIGLVFEDLL
jgi:hypothetical protein